MAIRYRSQRTEYKELWILLRNRLEARTDEDWHLPSRKRPRSVAERPGGIGSHRDDQDREDWRRVRESPLLGTSILQNEQQDATTPSAEDHSANMISHDTQPNTTARRAPLVLQQDTWWAIDDVLEPRVVFDPIPPTVIDKVRQQVREWDQQNSKWRRAGLVDLMCGWAAYRKRKSVWRGNGNEGKISWQGCSIAGRVCCLVKKGKIQLLPCAKNRRNLLGPGGEGYWFTKV